MSLEVEREMSVVSPKELPTRAALSPTEEQDLSRVRCLCGKWWAYRSGDTLVLRCKLCRRDVVITGENIRIDYR
jgi:hypothetical protein